MKKTVRGLGFAFGALVLLLSLGYIFQLPVVTRLWPWPDGRLSYLFIGSILTAISAALLWIGYSGELSVLPPGSLNTLVIAAGSATYLFQLASRENRANLIPHIIVFAIVALASGVTFLLSRRITADDSRSMPLPVRLSFGFFTATLILTGLALIFRAPIFPWMLNPDSSALFGWIFVGDAFYFLYGLIYPRWQNAIPQLLSFLAYDLVLIGPFLALFATVPPELRLNLILYVIILLYSGGLAIYYLFIHERTRIWSLGDGGRSHKPAKL